MASDKPIRSWIHIYKNTTCQSINRQAFFPAGVCRPTQVPREQTPVTIYYGVPLNVYVSIVPRRFSRTSSGPSGALDPRGGGGVWRDAGTTFVNTNSSRVK